MKQLSDKWHVASGKKRTRNRKSVLGLVVLAALVVLTLAGCGGAGEQAQPVSPANTPAPVDTPTLVPTNTPTVAPTETPTLAPTETPAPTDTPTPAPTDTPVPSDRPPASEEIVYTGTQYAADGSPQVNLSFDVEGDPELLYQILDTLDEYGVRTTFFMQGEWVQQYPGGDPSALPSAATSWATIPGRTAISNQ